MLPWDIRLARRLVAPLCNSRIVPNHLTTVRLLTGLAGAVLFATGEHPNLAALMMVLSNFLDHTDGELARLGGKSSRFGHAYDLASDAAVTILMFLGIGLGLTDGSLGPAAVYAGCAAGAAVAAIFHMRNEIEKRKGKSAVRQPRFAGFEAEDVLYLLPVVTLTGALEPFLVLAAVGAPIVALLIAPGYLRVLRGVHS